ncbi:ABC transporter ATP-binding protein (plasmid) [Priestia aryabhattai]
MDKGKIGLEVYSTYFKKYYFIYKKEVLTLLLIVLGTILLQLWTPQLLKNFIDSAKSEASLYSLTKLAILFIVTSLIIQVLAIISTFIGESLGWKATNELRADIIKHCLLLDISFHKKNKSSELVERVDGDTTQLSNFFSQFIVSMIGNFLLIIGILIVMYNEDPLIGASLTIFLILSTLSILKIRNFAVPFWIKVREVRTEFFGSTAELLEGVEVLKANDSTNYALQTYSHKFKKWLPIRLKAQLGSITLWMSILFIFTLGNAIAFAICSYLWSKGSISLGTVYMIFFYTELLRQPIEQIRVQITNLQSADASLKRINELFDIKNDIIIKPKDSIEEDLPEVVFKNVYFKYENNKVILRNIDFQLAKGNTLAIIGESGSGKTTISKLIMRLYEPYQGEIFLRGKNISSYDLTDLRRNISFVSQDVELFNTTVRNNITLFNSKITDETVLNLINSFGMKDHYDNLSNGLDTIIKEKGKNLSAGEAQMLIMCRALLKESEIFILDEASSRLDSLTDKIIQGKFAKYLKGKTVITITHRLQTIKDADYIMILSHGNIKEFGSREKLLKDSHSMYYEIVNTKRLGVTNNGG